MLMTRKRPGSRLPRACDLFVLGVLLGTLAGCGYAVVGAWERDRPQQPSLAIAPFGNQAREPDLERLMTAALHHTLLQSQVLLVGAEETASHRLQSTIRRFRTIPLSFDDRDNVLQYRTEVDIHIRLIETATKSPLLEQDISAAAEYLVSQVPANRVREDVVARQAALGRLAQQFADRCLALLAIALL